MKTIIKLTFFLFLLSWLISASCEKEKQNVKIIKELPAFYVGCNLHEGDISVIKDRQMLSTILDTIRLNNIVELQNIDFSKYDLLIGAASYTHGISNLEYSLSRTKDNMLLFNVMIHYNLTLPAGTFFCGIVIEKSPVNVLIKFETSSKF